MNEAPWHSLRRAVAADDFDAILHTDEIHGSSGHDAGNDAVLRKLLTMVMLARNSGARQAAKVSRYVVAIVTDCRPPSAEDQLWPTLTALLLALPAGLADQLKTWMFSSSGLQIGDFTSLAIAARANLLLAASNGKIDTFAAMSHSSILQLALPGGATAAFDEGNIDEWGLRISALRLLKKRKAVTELITLSSTCMELISTPLLSELARAVVELELRSLRADFLSAQSTKNAATENYSEILRLLDKHSELNSQSLSIVKIYAGALRHYLAERNSMAAADIVDRCCRIEAKQGTILGLSEQLSKCAAQSIRFFQLSLARRLMYRVIVLVSSDSKIGTTPADRVKLQKAGTTQRSLPSGLLRRFYAKSRVVASFAARSFFK